MTDLPSHRLYPPGSRKNNKTYAVRFTHDGHQHEIVTNASTEQGARDYLGRFLDELDRYTERSRRLMPQAMALGEFEHWLLATYRLDGEHVIDQEGRRLRFFRSNGGYMAGRIPFRQWSKSVLEHRLKFLLAHRWLPSTVDHVNGVRNDNTLANLEASTPALQSRGVQERRGKFAGEDL